ncbi:hypothetical protein COCON_G00029990 [Conger conger]|uniref:Fibronectin type-III domain-containing protein n=1 Tax=Conger conger TaxID=82655 RepID=A0A9Q1DYM8_CONCO|nr:hypothetical protein COCON_G00029990 [Conger conger]
MREPAAILFVFCSLIQCTTCNCNITCTTDYISSLNCSCSGPRLASYYYLEAECGDDEDHIKVSCEIKAPQRWCTLELDPEEYQIDALSTCTVQAKNSNGEGGVDTNDSTTLILSENIKPQPPFNISLTVSDSSYNVSWKTAYADGHYLMGLFIYRVRIWIKGEEEPSYHYVYEDRTYLEIPSSLLRSRKDYEVNVQAKVNPARYRNDFSEWSPTAILKTKDEEDNGHYRQYCFILLIVVPCLLCFFGKRRLWLTKVQVYIPSPEVFFSPLYHAYEGDFKKWVGPAFTLSESECLEGSVAISVMKEKQVKSLERLCEGEAEDSGSTASSSFLNIGSHSSSEQGTEDGSCSQGSNGSAGHISIDTVTVLEDQSQSSGRSWDAGSSGGHFVYPPFGPGGSADSEALGLLDERCRWDAVISSGRVSGGTGPAEGASTHPPLSLLEPHLHNGDRNEEDQSSMESFSFGEHSEDGYPRVTLDMDTFDSGFQESDCSSPAHTDPDMREKTDAPMLGESFHSNYVKQWVAATDASSPRGETGKDS